MKAWCFVIQVIIPENNLIFKFLFILLQLCKKINYALLHNKILLFLFFVIKFFEPDGTLLFWHNLASAEDTACKSVIYLFVCSKNSICLLSKEIACYFLMLNNIAFSIGRVTIWEYQYLFVINTFIYAVYTRFTVHKQSLVQIIIS